MKFPRLRTLLLVPVGLFVAFYLVSVVMVATSNDNVDDFAGPLSPRQTVAIFGASGTAGDGILKAAMADPAVQTIQVITRRVTPRMEQGVAAGKVQVTSHMDYLDYAAVLPQVAQADAVYWAIGASSAGMDQPAYRRIHLDFPLRFVVEWMEISTRETVSFHYISSSDISADSRWMWAREKVAAENALFEFASSNRLKVIAYRPDYIGPTSEQAHLGQTLLYGFFAPVGAAVKATQIGQAMLEVTARIPEFENGDKVGTRGIHRYADAFERREG
ncbi:MAG: hypothetical protein QNJ40_13610 [Xanthomonadales bacterium]|nr:hypothetical protein [Xanthomonadales bacterium]